LPCSRRRRRGREWSFDRLSRDRRGWRSRFGLVNLRLGLDNRGLWSRQRRALDHFDSALDRRFLLRKILVPNLLGEFFRNRVGRDADVDTFATDLFNEALGVQF
jgi:hypothetical protein